MNAPNNPLPEQFRYDNSDFRLRRRDGRVALFTRTKFGYACSTYEVVVIQTHPAERMFGRDLPEREAMPPSESWGTLGWTYTNIVEAEARFKRLCRCERQGHLQPEGFPASASKGSPGQNTSSSHHDAPAIP